MSTSMLQRSTVAASLPLIVRGGLRHSSTATAQATSTQAPASTSSGPWIHFPLAKVGTLAHYIRREKQLRPEPIWTQLRFLRKYGPYYDQVSTLPVSLQLPSSTTDPDAQYWRSVADSRGIREAISRLVADGRVILQDHPYFPPFEALDPDRKPGRGPPAWLALHLVANRVQTKEDARIATDFTLNQLYRIPTELKIPFLLLAVRALVEKKQFGGLRWSEDVSIEYMVKQVLTLPSQTPDLHYEELSHLLRKLQSEPSCIERITPLLDTVQKKQSQSVTLAGTLDCKKKRPFHSPPHFRSLENKFAKPGKAVIRYQNKQTTSRQRHNYGDFIRALSQYAISGKNDTQEKWDEMKNVLTGIDVWGWNDFVQALVRDRELPLDGVLAIWEALRKLGGRSLKVDAYTTMVDGLRKRGARLQALEVWQQLLVSRRMLDKRALTAGVLAHGAAGRMKEAFEVMDSFGSKNFHPDKDASYQPMLPSESKAKYPLIQLDTVVVNALMDKLSRGGRPDVVFKIWDIMEGYYGVVPDTITLSILLDSSRRADLIDESMEVALNHLGIRNPFKSILATLSTEPQPSTPSAYISKMLSKKPESGLWNGTWADKQVRFIFREMLLGNWPELLDVRCPVGTYVPMTMTERLWSTERVTPKQVWPTIIPNARTFHAYIFVLGWNELQPEIPLVLAWMRHLQIEPLFETLSIALMYFADVARLPPLFERFELKDRAEYGGDYGRLRRWIAEWLGEGALPSEDAIASMRRSGDRWYARRH